MLTTVYLLFAQLIGCGAPPPTAAVVDVAPLDWTAPSLSAIPEGAEGDLIRRGRALSEQTATLLPNNVAGSLSCKNCHLGAGTTNGAIPWIGVAHRYPTYRARTGREDDLEDRINDCFERSLNGVALERGSAEMTAMVAYMGWLSAEVPADAPLAGVGVQRIQAADPPDATRGQAIYAKQCASCHQPNGQGLTLPDGTVPFPPLWGPRSFNIGAGMARLHTAAGFIQAAMPLGQGGSLTNQEAYDVALYVSTQDRPDYAGKEHDWPKGGRPDDARY